MCKSSDGFSLTVLIEPLTFYLIVLTFVSLGGMLEENVKYDSILNYDVRWIYSGDY